MIDYLYYKLYQATLKGSLRDIPRYIAPIYLGGLVSFNIAVVYLFLVKIDVLPYFLSSAKQGGYISLVFIFASFFYYNKVRCAKILNRYINESEKQRKFGNFIVALYVAISFLLIFVVAFYKPGYLPKR
ncbi:MAG: hypothetical protein K2Y12_04530 [Chitinophagaceae bacterium]|nr:hypothetical protein [Chitinophagaceae bacterium]